MVEHEPAARFERIGWDLVLDFINTGSWEGARLFKERLYTFGDLARWGREAGILSAEGERDLVERAGNAPLAAAAVLGQAIELRAILHDVFAAIARGAPRRAARLRAFTAVLAPTLARLDVIWDGDHAEWRITEPGALDAVLRHVVWSTAQLLTTGDLHRVRECAGSECGWLFIDATKSHSRRWCMMAGA